MRIIALDIGDAWTGIAITDPSGILARPYKTIAATDLLKELETVIKNEKITDIIIGIPQTMRGTESKQTEKVRESVTTLQTTFPFIEYHLKDERLTSKQAASLRPAKNKEDKLMQHAVAAALILSDFLEQRAFERSDEDFQD